MNATAKLSLPSVRLQKFSFRFAEQVLNSKLALKEEIEHVLLTPISDVDSLSRPALNKLLEKRFVGCGWTSQPGVFDDPEDPGAKMDFLKDRIGIEVGFGHASFIGIDLLKFQVASYSALDKIDVGVYIVTTSKFQKFMKTGCSQNIFDLREGKALFATFQKCDPGSHLRDWRGCLMPKQNQPSIA